MIEQIRLAASNDKRPMKNRTYLIIIIIQWNGINEKKTAQNDRQENEYIKRNRLVNKKYIYYSHFPVI